MTLIERKAAIKPLMGRFRRSLTMFLLMLAFHISPKIRPDGSWWEDPVL